MTIAQMQQLDELNACLRSWDLLFQYGDHRTYLAGAATMDRVLELAAPLPAEEVLAAVTARAASYFGGDDLQVRDFVAWFQRAQAQPKAVAA